MEQKKTLWIIAAVGLFLAVIIGTACIIYTPSAQNAPTIASISPFEKSSADKSGWTNPANTEMSAYSNEPAQVATQPQNPSVSEMVVLSDNTTVYTTPQYQPEETTTIDLNVLKNELAAELKPETKNQNQNINITVNVSDSSSAAINNNEKQMDNRKADFPRDFGNKTAPVKEVKETPKQVAQIQPPAPVKESVKVEKKVTSTADTKATASVKTTAPAAKTTTTVKAEVKKTTPEPKKVTQYWVQVGSYSAKKTAEVARSALDENKIPSDIFTYKDAKDNLYFRVRVGPYTTKSEAEYWRTRITKIDDFAKAESYVVSTTN